ncbi:nose resistant to fluoxetine protein 6-like isoform X2 [Tachypleus tridentatus]|uniref:nose resistant to fluoxetine protein 6-like isoform X2 n=1 Tax=Tachypleus tridentatus TaxID=6853 RepID=UPI003FD48D9E
MWNLYLIFCLVCCVFGAPTKHVEGKTSLASNLEESLTENTWSITNKDNSDESFQQFTTTQNLQKDNMANAEWSHSEKISDNRTLSVFATDSSKHSNNSYSVNVSASSIKINTVSTSRPWNVRATSQIPVGKKGTTTNPLEENVSISRTATEKSLKPLSTFSITTMESMKISSDSSQKSITFNALQEFSQTFENLKSRSRQLLKSVIKQILPTLVRYSSQVTLSGGCTASIFQILFGLRRLDDWALKLIDASGKAPSGLLHGTVAEFGDYEECHDIMATNSRGKNMFHGQYCAIDVQPFLPRHFEYHVYTANKTLHEMEEMLAYMYRIKFRLGFCVPSKCGLKDVRRIAEKATEELQLNVTVPWCDAKQPWNWDTVEESVVWFNVFLFCLVVVATVVEIVQRYFKPLEMKNYISDHCKQTVYQFLGLLRCFSLYTNMRTTLTTKTGKNDLPVVHGMRVFSINWIILGNIYYLLSYNQVGALLKVLNLGKDLGFQLVVQSIFAVDTFFFISGLLVTHITLRKLEKNDGRFNLLKFYIHRYWRLTPAFILVSGIVMVLPVIGSGPIWHEKLDSFAKGCRKNWWTNLLYISNFLEPEDMCLPHGFYLACDMQFFLLSPVIIMTLYRLQKEFLRLIFTMPYTHFAPYCVGMAAGYILFVYRQRKICMHPNVALLGWITAFACNLALVFGILQWNSGYLPKQTTGAVYAGVSRFAWSLSLSWVVVACMSGYGGIINTILSWTFYVPLCRVSYLVFLLHPAWIIVFNSHYRTTLYYSSCLMCYLFVSHTSVSYFMGFVCSLFYQFPFQSLERFLSKRKSTAADDHNRDVSKSETEEENRCKKWLELREEGGLNNQFTVRWRESGSQNKAYTETNETNKM